MGKFKVEIESAYTLGKDRWDDVIDDFQRSFPNGGMDGVLPPHFLRATFPKIGGRIIVVEEGQKKEWGLLWPTRNRSGERWVVRSNTMCPEKRKAIEEAVGGGREKIHWYDVQATSKENWKGKMVGRNNGITFSEPDTRQAVEAQELQRTVWRVEDKAYLYPFDLYHPESGMATKLVATKEDEMAGFLFGFYSRGKRQWYGSQKGFKEGEWIESQLMGVETKFRQHGIARQLKLIQRRAAQHEGIDVIHWTVDPLQAGNARLNLNSLGGVAVQFYENYYAFRNSLNRVPASRIGISWVVNSARVEEYSQGPSKNYSFEELAAHSSTCIINPLEQKDMDTNIEADIVLLEIPSDWNNVQASDLAIAEKWRRSSDRVLKFLLDRQKAEYGITGITLKKDENRPHLIIEKLGIHSDI